MYLNLSIKFFKLNIFIITIIIYFIICINIYFKKY